ncbi:PLC-like phosphodiesterase [Aureobasidium namibiae CBS 147.97]|uniref:Phosphoinositide phospholipase C n=1 Tax=Aureobasidium namibiae CBS 147.97 TaxID=1043004 RepID=A0A074XDT1_9PEZI|nr:PLC-like phosphodiesterase [Aureobasidium namibiae CBS 147.97]KEQ72781.1 PLC-like phosphodiesterase [Aureobasidium namibiae CBS 147.97]
MDTTNPQAWSPAILNYVKGFTAEFDQVENIEANKLNSPAAATDDHTSNRLLQYLGSEEANAMAPVVLDTTHPISDYFISSSHNTYLWGNQLYGKASTKAYQKVLERGCRCVEIDVWDGDDSDSETSDSSADSDSDAENQSGIKKLSRKFKDKMGLSKSKPKSESKPKEKPASASPSPELESVGSAGLRRTVSKTEPRVLHGYTATKEISFRDVCATIRDYAFTTSDLPVIVSLEVHTCPAQQEIMVDIIRDMWAPYLVDLNALTGHEISLPTLESLRNKILIKVKYTAPEQAVKKSTGPAVASNNAEPESGSEDDSQETAVKKSHIITALASMGVYTRGCHFKDFDQPEAKLPNHIFSLSESKINEVHKRDHSALFRHNKRFMMRVYPKGIRVSSSNLDPAPFWRMGAQIVALNWQYINAATMLNQAMFHATGGWVLKPEGYRSFHRAQSQITALDRGRLDLTIELLAGQDIGPADKKLHLYVRSELHIEDMEEINGGSLPEGGSTKEGQIKAVTELGTAGRSPDFGRQLLQFKVDGVAEELTFVRFKVMDDDTFSRDNLVAWACFRLSRLQAGIRKIRLYDCEGQQTNGMLLVRISKRLDLE